MIGVVSEYKTNRPIVLERDNWTCHYCDFKLDPNATKANDLATIDHVIPRCLGGRDNIENLVACCGLCNTRKGSMSYDEFMALNPRSWPRKQKVTFRPGRTETLLERYLRRGTRIHGDWMQGGGQMKLSSWIKYTPDEVQDGLAEKLAHLIEKEKLREEQCKHH